MRQQLSTIAMAVILLLVSAVARAVTFSVPESELPHPLVFVAYGDMRFTNPVETNASNPRARQALVTKIAAERPAAIFINGDVPYHGLADDYGVFLRETTIWRERHLRVYPALGNHELAACQEDQCLARWWDAFPDLRGRRWYSLALGMRLLVLALDSTAPLLPGTEQRTWFDWEVANLDGSVRAVLIVMHHPPVADVQTVKLIDHNPRPNEETLADALARIAPHSRARFVVSAGHIHNYERLERMGVVYLVSGGGGAHPYEIDRTAADSYQSNDFPNYHYVRFEMSALRLSGQMIRLADSDAPHPDHWEVRDRFELRLQP